MFTGGPGSGTRAVDDYRQSKGDEALNTLLAGHGMKATNTTHLNSGELCVEVLARLKNDNTHCVSDAVLMNTINGAVNNLIAGKGHHKAQGDHSGGNLCITVIANATS
jgi:hypothetical protein